MFKKEDLHISILKFGRDEAENGVNLDDLSKHIKDKGYDISRDRLKAYFGETYEPMDLSKRGVSYDDRAEEKSTLTIESTFRLIEYEEFKNANSSSFWATVFAITAIVISIFATYKSIHYSEKQMNSDISINKSQLNEIKSLKFDDKKISEKIEKLTLKIDKLIKENNKHKANNTLNLDAQKSRAR